MQIKHFNILASILAMVVFFAACGNGGGLNIGHERLVGEFLSSVMTGVKSDKTDFKADAITLDFYFGCGHELSDTLGYEYDDDGWKYYQAKGVGIYFCNAVDYAPVYNECPYKTENYEKIEGFHLVRMIEMEDFNSDEYRVETHWLRKPKYHHKETLTVPSGVIRHGAEYNGGSYFCFVVIQFFYIEGEDAYVQYLTGCLTIEYKFLNDDTVRLSKPDEIVF